MNRVRRGGVVVALVLVAGVCTGCVGSDPYCAAVDKHQKTLKSFGTVRTTADFRSYAKAAKAVEAAAPAGIRPQWKKVATATQGVVDAHKKAGVSIESVAKDDSGLSSRQRAIINAAYSAYNDSATARLKAAKNVQEKCGVKLGSS